MHSYPFSLGASQRLNSLRVPAKVAMQVVTTLLVFSLFLFPNLASAASPHIYDVPQAGPPGSQTQTVGNGWDPNATLDIYFDSTNVGLVDTDNNGSFGMALKAPTIRQNGLTIQIPKDAVQGQHWITAVERITQLQAQVAFTVRVDWPQFHYGPDRTGFNPNETVLSPQTVGNLTKRWTYNFGGGCCTSSPTIAEGTIYISPIWSNLYAMDASTGALRWTAPASGPPYTGPSVVNGVVYAIGGDGYIEALDALTGVTLWSYFVDNTGYGEAPVVANGVVYVASSNNQGGNAIYALDAGSGKLVWKYPTGQNFFYTSLSLANGVVYDVDYSGNLYALDAGTGALLWDISNAGSDAAPVIANGVIYVGPGRSIYARKASTGEIIWQYTTGGYVFGSPAVANGVVYVTAFDGYIYALDAGTGALQWKFATGDQVLSSPAVANGVVYFGSEDNTVYALDAQTGALLWKYITGSPITSSPAVVNGMLYIGSWDGNLYAFGLPDQQMSDKFSPPERADPARLTPNWALQPNREVTPPLKK